MLWEGDRGARVSLLYVPAELPLYLCPDHSEELISNTLTRIRSLPPPNVTMDSKRTPVGGCRSRVSPPKRALHKSV